MMKRVKYALAMSWKASARHGVREAPAGEAVNYWDMGSADGVGTLTPTNSILQTATGTTPSATHAHHAG